MQHMQQNLDPQEGTSSAAVRPKQQNPNPRGKNKAPNEGTPSDAAKPKGANKKKMQENANPNPRARNPGPNRGPVPHQPNAHFKPNNGPGQHWPNPRFLPKRGPVPHQPHPDHNNNDGPPQLQPHLTPNDGSRPYNETDELGALRFHLQEAQHTCKTNLYKMTAANHKAAAAKTQNDWVRLQLQCHRQNAQKTILELQKQLEEARRKTPEENFTPEVSEAPVEDSNTAVTAAELSVDASTQTAEAPHTDSTDVKTVREAELEVQCKKQQEEIEQLREQLLKTQKNLEEEVAKRKDQEQRANCELAELKDKLSTSEALCEKNDLKAQNLKEELEKTKASHQEIVEQKLENTTIRNQLGQTEEEKITLQEFLLSLEETIKQQEDQSNVANPENSPARNETLQDNQPEKEEASATKPERPEARDDQVPKEKPKKKKKRNWFWRLFT
ncbi:RNA-binding protein 33-like isoform X2 [Simochromis diagramma]|uniref:RNA-binding protein 33-like isoform X1 n=1 Tax=Simochromis diagramma TaxID=43689 RepID=UPI001A7EE090|nr:RNA-binding protein 33-like isoform X1 [Simochromis diagramma]XP_039878722.1 RNA-binding protein 33-like isoform X2 [Simochromis diagramma]